MKAKKIACGERLQRFLIAFMMLVILGLLSKGYNLAALILLAFVAIMFAIYGLFDFCPSTWVLNKIFGSCYCECKDEDNENQL
jgi:hypothetical protein